MLASRMSRRGPRISLVVAIEHHHDGIALGGTVSSARLVGEERTSPASSLLGDIHRRLPADGGDARAYDCARADDVKDIAHCPH